MTGPAIGRPSPAAVENAVVSPVSLNDTFAPLAPTARSTSHSERARLAKWV